MLKEPGLALLIAFAPVIAASCSTDTDDSALFRSSLDGCLTAPVSDASSDSPDGPRPDPADAEPPDAPRAPAEQEICRNGVDDDGDGAVDEEDCCELLFGSLVCPDAG
jgi:hypothetical protein